MEVNSTEQIRTAARRLCIALDRRGVMALPNGRTRTVMAKRGNSEQSVAIREHDDIYGWFWVWEPYRTDASPDLEFAAKLGEEDDLSRRLANIVAIPVPEM